MVHGSENHRKWMEMGKSRWFLAGKIILWGIFVSKPPVTPEAKWIWPRGCDTSGGDLSIKELDVVMDTINKNCNLVNKDADVTEKNNHNFPSDRCDCPNQSGAWFNQRFFGKLSSHGCQ